jgi:hypothetical protein
MDAPPKLSPSAIKMTLIRQTGCWKAWHKGREIAKGFVPVTHSDRTMLSEADREMQRDARVIAYIASGGQS